MPERDPTTIQTVILSKERFETKEDANNWIREHDFIIKVGAPDETEDSWRYRQREPSLFVDGSFRTIEITDGVKAVVGHLKEKKSTSSEAEIRAMEILAPLSLEIDQIQELSFVVDKFRSTAAAKSWLKNHGIEFVDTPRQLRDAIVVQVRSKDEFEPGTLHKEKLTRDVNALVGIPKELRITRKVVPPSDATNDEKRTAQEKRAEKWGIEVQRGKGEKLTFQAGEPTDENDYGDPVNLHFTISIESEARSARARFKSHADEMYEKRRSKEIVHERIVRRMLKFGMDVSFDSDDPLDTLLPSDLKDRLSKRAKLDSDPIEFVKRGELFVRKVDGDEDPEKVVRMFGIVMKPEVPDCEGDVTSVEEIERACFEFMKEFQTIGFMHKKDVSDRVKLIQNVVAPTDFDFPLPDGGTKKIAMGTWYQELFSDDEEIVSRVRKKQLNGLSIGGFARREPVTETVKIKMLSGLLSEAQKREIEDAVNKRSVSKAEGDPALNRFLDLRVEEVSLVDAAANEEEFFIVKNRKDVQMGKESETKIVDETKARESNGSTNDSNPSSDSTLAQRVLGRLDAIEAKLEKSAKSEDPKEGTPQENVAIDPVTKGFDEVRTRLDAIDRRLNEQAVKIDEFGTVRAAAKGESVPETTARAEDKKDEEPESKWSGSAVHGVFGKFRRRTA